MVSTQYTPILRPEQQTGMVLFERRCETVGIALRISAPVTAALPDEMMRLLAALDAVPDRPNGRG